MKSAVIILLLSVSGLEEIHLGIKGSSNIDEHLSACESTAESWREVNTTYREGKNQGNYTHDGKLLVGYICI
tara:strand:- start:899 stop:1114 length:216 start_codon:yes stop_codon:yes gene_type:complete